jgi:hypothetical protein
MTVTETMAGPCVSLTTGTLSPDLRVNYAYGMVLGLDEFLQEQLHNLSKDYLHERALHGFGTVSGLAVTTAPVPGANDFQVSVSTGVGIDQWGREIVIRCDQCARLGAWLAAQEQASAGILGQHLGPSGELTVYVVASYAECLDALVPLPGQPCSSSEQSRVASRIRDAWDVELRWSPPAMPRWDTDRRLARLLDAVQIVVGLNPLDSDESAITDAVLALADVADDGPSGPGGGPSGGIPWQLPAEGAPEALDRIFTVWVTRVRPGLHPDLIDPEAASDPAILLSTITCVPAIPFDVANPEVVFCDDPDDEGRPYLLSTELIQELRWFNDAIAAPPAPDGVPAIELVTLEASVDGNNLTTVDAWFQLGDPVQLPATIHVDDEDGGSWEFATSASTAFSSVWTLTAPDVGVTNREGIQLRATFPAADVFIGDATTSLGQLETSTGTAFLNRAGNGDVFAFTDVRGAVVAPVEKPPVASDEFVTITPLSVNPERLIFELWFHPEPRGSKDDVQTERPALRVFDELTGANQAVQIQGPASFYSNVWQVALKNPSPDKGIPTYLRFLFLAKEFLLMTPDGEMSLADWIDKERIEFIGFDADQLTVTAFARVATGQINALTPLHDVPVAQPVDGPIAGPVLHPLLAPDALVAKKATSKKTAAPARKTTPAKKAAAKKTAAPARKTTPAKKAAAKKTAAPARKTTPAKKAPARRGGGNR